MINGVLAKHGSIYEEDALDPTKVQQVTTDKSKFWSSYNKYSHVDLNK